MCLSSVAYQALSSHPLLEFVRVDTRSHPLSNFLKIDTLIPFVHQHIGMVLYRLSEPVVP
jgi:hypothetical protein